MVSQVHPPGPPSTGRSCAESPEPDRRISVAEACALLRIARATFYRQYLTEFTRDRSYERFAMGSEVGTRRLTLSAARVRAHLDEIVRDPTWAGPYCPPGAWGSRTRRRAQDDEQYRKRVPPPEVPPPGPEQPPADELAADGQGDLFAP